jgi:ATP-dependent helicase/nuclease subunit B
MKTGFIQQTAAFAKNDSKTANKIILVPSKRAELYFNRALYQSGIQVLCFDDWVKDLIKNHARIADKNEIILAYFEVYAQQNLADNAFEEFIKWASTAIDDFIAIDHSLVDAKQLYNYLTDTKAIDLWNPEQKALTDNQLRYLHFFKSQHQLYLLFHQTLASKKWVTKASALNYLAQHILDFVKDEFYYVTGFNALNPAQKRIFELLNKAGKATFIWDTDSYYLNQVSNEAGENIRQNIAHFGPSNSIVFNQGLSSIDQEQKNIQLIASSRQLPQAKFLYQLLEGFTEEQINQTAIITANESLLPAILSSLPEKVKNVNVSLSYPLKNLSVFQWANAYLKFLNSVKSTEESHPRYYYKSLIEWLNNPMSRRVFTEVDQVIEVVTRYNVPYLSADKIIDLSKIDDASQLGIFLKVSLQPEDLIHTVLNFYNELEKVLSDAETLLLEEINCVRELFIQLQEQFKSEFIRQNISIKGFKKILEQSASNLSLAYKGQPLKGLQILSLLETNCLGFENVILIGCNEGLLPKSMNHHSFIPFDVRRVFDLPMPAYHEAIFAYSFYRLIQHPKNVYLMYDTDSDSFGSGEMSRYLLQLKNELQYAKIDERIVMFENLNLSDSTDHQIQNSEELIPAIKNFITHRGITPTSLSTYISCSLKFYYKYIIKLKEEEEIEEFLGADTLGKLVHKTLELLYFPFVKQVLTIDKIQSMQARFETAFAEACHECDVNKLVEDGKNLLVVNIAKQYVAMYLNYESQFIKEASEKNQVLTLESLEERLSVLIPYQDSANNLEILLTGFADRIDRVGELYRILDFKTGKVEPRTLTLKDFEDLFSNPDFSKALQLLHYSFVMNKLKGDAKINSGIISLRALSQGFMIADFSKLGISDVELYKLYEERIGLVVSELLNPITTFSKTQELKHCEYCSFNNLCMRN